MAYLKDLTSEPDYQGLTYDGQVWSEMTTLGGWGDLSIQPHDNSVQEATYNFGVYGGAASKINGAGVDTNSAECVDRVMAISIYNPSTTAYQASFTAKKGGLGLQTEALVPPTFDSAVFKAMGALTASAVLASLI
uniref:Uncharacterized protein n=1 Tax=Strombidium inclinatum TaxID=197538 RepID=A0A7S3IU85_9SPIT|mmetsp:Transcript_38080/g.58109  ORF Transcript_38080/g.58109 Transcript_38080/m.58109 type:complete len:135 (+) Transcript_38080:201-605(+)